MKVHDTFVGLAFLGLGIFIAAYSQTLAAPRGQAYGPGFFPLLIGTGMALVGLAISLQGLRSYRASALAEAPEWAEGVRPALRFWIIPIAIIFFVVAVTPLGFLITATVILSVVMTVNSGRPLISLTTALVVALVVNLCFASLLHVPLPWGPLTSISGWFIW